MLTPGDYKLDSNQEITNSTQYFQPGWDPNLGQFENRIQIQIQGNSKNRIRIQGNLKNRIWIQRNLIQAKTPAPIV